ncbi:uncharacterized protein Tco025E_10032, partial [Trypanosoma conorhini]
KSSPVLRPPRGLPWNPPRRTSPSSSRIRGRLPALPASQSRRRCSRRRQTSFVFVPVGRQGAVPGARRRLRDTSEAHSMRRGLHTSAPPPVGVLGVGTLGRLYFLI